MDSKQCAMTHEERIERAYEIATKAMKRRPGSSNWGLYSYDDRPAPFCGSGTGAFFWFPDEETTKAFLCEHLPFIVDAGWDDEESRTFAMTFSSLWADLETASWPQRIEALNGRLRHLVQIQWVGDLDGLCQAEGAARSYRSWYRENAELEGGGEAIPDSEKEAFLAALEEYGL